MKGVIHVSPLASPRVRLPFVLLNLAMSADGKIATANRGVSSFGSPRDLAHLYALRASVDAVMCGARTVRDEGVTLDLGGARYRRLRRVHGLAEHHVRVIVSGSGSLDPELPVFRALPIHPRPTTAHAPVVVLTTERASPTQCARLATVADAVLVCGAREVDWPAALAHLRARWGVKRLLCEGGGELNDALFRAGLVHELHLTICPFLFGGRTAPTLADGVGFLRLSDAARFRLVRRRRVGDELFCVFARVLPG